MKWKGLDDSSGLMCPMVPVVSNGRLVGLLTMDNLAELLLIRSALDKQGRQGHRGNSVEDLLSNPPRLLQLQPEAQP